MSVCWYMKDQIPYAVISGLLFLVLLVYSVNYFSGLFRDIQDLAEAARYRDFTTKYVEKKGVRMPGFRHYLNSINQTFLAINREKEAKQHYLKKILELVDTGILAYDIETYDVLCINDSLADMLNIPRIKNVRWMEKGDRNKRLYQQLIALETGGDRLVDLTVGPQTIKVLANTSLFKVEEHTYRLIAFHNINTTLEEIESGAWKRLLSVMTHEIMNSVVPVSSLADTLKKQIMYLRDDPDRLTPDDFQDIEDGMEAIKRRSDGLLKFAETYRTLNKTIIPEISETDVNEMLVNIYRLMQPSLRLKNIVLETMMPDYIPHLQIDRKLIEQTIVNFITNARDALAETRNPHIILSAGQDRDGHVFITVADNGKGIPSGLMEQIFIPFFSTRKNGSGIGLSLSRQIIKAHDATLKVQTKEGEGSAFTMTFR